MTNATNHAPLPAETLAAWDDVARRAFDRYQTQMGGGLRCGWEDLPAQVRAAHTAAAYGAIEARLEDREEALVSALFLGATRGASSGDPALMHAAAVLVDKLGVIGEWVAPGESLPVGEGAPIVSAEILWNAHRAALGGKSSITGTPLPSSLPECAAGAQGAHWGIALAVSLILGIAEPHLPVGVSRELAAEVRERVQRSLDGRPYEEAPETAREVP